MEDWALEMTDIRLPETGGNEAESALRVRPGEIHALLGDRCAVSALLRCAAGEKAAGVRAKVRCAGGAILTDGRFFGAGSASVMELLRIGKHGGSTRKAEARAKEICEKLGWNIDLRSPVKLLTREQRLQAAALRGLYFGAETVLLDRPAPVWQWREDPEWDGLLEALRTAGKAAVFAADSPRQAGRADFLHTVKDGKLIEISREEAEKAYRWEQPKSREMYPGGIVLKVRDLTGPGIEKLSLEVREGEILGVACASGGGGEALADALTGRTKPKEGTVRLLDRELNKCSVRERLALGVGYLPGADREQPGDASLGDMLLLRRYRQSAFREGGWRKVRSGWSFAEGVLRDCGADDELAAADRLRDVPLFWRRFLSLRRENEREAALLIAERPTEGITDGGERQRIWAELLAARLRRRAVLLISSDIRELLTLSDRVLTLRDGKIVGELDQDVAAPMEIELNMYGAEEDVP